MGKVLIVALETVASQGIVEVLQRVGGETGDLAVDDVKVLASADTVVPVGVLADVVGCRKNSREQEVSVEVLLFREETEKFFAMGSLMTRYCVLDEALGQVPGQLLDSYGATLLQSYKQKKTQVSAQKGAPKASGKKPEESAKQESVPRKDPESQSETGASKSKSALSRAKKMSFEDVLCSRGVDASHTGKLRGVFEASSSKDEVRGAVMSTLGLSEGGKVLAKLDGCFAQLHELAASGKS